MYIQAYVASHSMGPGPCFPALKQPGREAAESPPSSADVK
jgi:hypothetical protein